MENSTENSDTNQNSADNIAAFVNKLQDKKFRLLIYSPLLVAILCWLLTMVLPIANIMRFHPEAVTIFGLQDYKLNSGPLILLCLLILLGAIGVAFSEQLLKKGKTNGAATLCIVLGVVSFVGLGLFTAESESIRIDLANLTTVRTDSGSGATCMTIGGIISSIYGVSYGICLKLIQSGKIKITSVTK